MVMWFIFNFHDCNIFVIATYFQYHIIFLIAVNCGDPELPSAANDSVPTIEGYDNLPWPIEGNTIRFSCPPGLELTQFGEPSSDLPTCTASGEWDPGPSNFMCTNGKFSLIILYTQMPKFMDFI